MPSDTHESLSTAVDTTSMANHGRKSSFIVVDALGMVKACAIMDADTKCAAVWHVETTQVTDKKTRNSAQGETCVLKKSQDNCRNYLNYSQRAIHRDPRQRAHELP